MHTFHRLGSVVAGALLAVVVMMPAASAASATVSVADYRFSPTPFRAAQGTVVTWHNSGPHTHTATGDAPLSLWNTGSIVSGADSPAVTMFGAGTFAYHCSIHPTMHGTIAVPTKVSPKTGTTATTFTIRVASAAKAGFTFDIQQKVGTGPWTAWKTGVAGPATTFKATAAGTYAFRARLVRTSSGATSGYSPKVAVTVS